MGLRVDHPFKLESEGLKRLDVVSGERLPSGESGDGFGDWAEGVDRRLPVILLLVYFNGFHNTSLYESPPRR